MRVDQILDVEDAVIKAIHPSLNASGIYRGATFLDDGTLGLVLNTVGILAQAGIHGLKKAVASAAPVETSAMKPETRSCLLIELMGPGLYAVPREAVYRIEDFSPEAVSHSGDYEILSYRGQALRILDANQMVFGAVSADAAKGRTLVVIERDQALFGIRVKSVLEVADLEDISTDLAEAAHGIQGHAAFQGKTVTLLDLGGLLVKPAA